MTPVNPLLFTSIWLPWKRSILPTFQRACHPCCCCVSSAWHTAHHHMVLPCKFKSTTESDWQRGRLAAFILSCSSLCVLHTLHDKLHINVDDFTWMSSVNCPSALVIFSVRLAWLMLLLKGCSSDRPAAPLWKTSCITSPGRLSANQRSPSNHTTSVLEICFAYGGCQISLDKYNSIYFLDVMLDCAESFSSKETGLRYSILVFFSISF